jgi:hypothetical protein
MNLEYQAKHSLEPSRTDDSEEPTILSVLSTTPQALEALPPRERAFALENAIRANIGTGLEERTLPLRHWIANGVYVREIFMPAGTVVVGWIHKHEHVAIMQQGDISIYDETGLQRMKGPCTFISRTGVKRALYIHTDTLFTTIHSISHLPAADIERLKQEIGRVAPGADIIELKREVAAETNAEYEEFMLTQENQGLLR